MPGLKSSYRILFLIGLSFVCGERALAQEDCLNGFRISVLDAARQRIGNFRIEVTNLDYMSKQPWLTENQQYARPGTYFVGAMVGTTIPGNFLLQVSAEGFERFESRFRFPHCAVHNYELKLKPKGSAEKAEFERLFTLHGKVFDEESKPFDKASVEARTADGRVYQTLSNAYGYYEIGLPKGAADIRVKGYGIRDAVFEKFLVEKDYSVLNVPVCRKCAEKESEN